MGKYQELRYALSQNPTPGPWRHTTYMSGTQNVEFPGARGVTFGDEVLDADARAICSDNDTKPFPWIDVSHRPEDSGDDRDPQRTRNARYIAACHPNAIRALLAERDALREAAQAALIYDQAIQSCANDPNAMSSFCTAVGDDLDTLYEAWITKSRAALAQEQGGSDDPTE